MDRFNVYVIEDNADKQHHIVKGLNNLADNAEFQYGDNYRDAIGFILDNKEFIDLIVLDWTFPSMQGGRPQYGVGNLVLNVMKNNGIDTKTIICTADQLNINLEDYPFVVGHILYDEDKSMTKEFNSILHLRSLVRKPIQGRYQRKMSSTPWWRQ